MSKTYFNVWLISILAFLIISLTGFQKVYAYSGNGSPLKFISSCEIDLNADFKGDIVFLAETLYGYEVIALIRNNDFFKAYILEKNAKNMLLSCHFGKEIAGTNTGKGVQSKKKYKINGAYVKLEYLEGAATVFFWDKDKFKKVWVAD